MIWKTGSFRDRKYAKFENSRLSFTESVYKKKMKVQNSHASNRSKEWYNWFDGHADISLHWVHTCKHRGLKLWFWGILALGKCYMCVETTKDQWFKDMKKSSNQVSEKKILWLSLVKSFIFLACSSLKIWLELKSMSLSISQRNK